jgi:tryptophanyl-tRNA synthetase
MPKVILTGIQSNTSLHIGNYIGGILPMLKTQTKLDDGDSMYMFVPDLHSFTLPIDHSNLYQNTIDNLKLYIASGLDLRDSRVTIFRQSFVPAHSELCWILSCFSYFGEMERMTQFKDKSQKHNQSVGVGLFSYPILMAADILLYNTDYVPVGLDQQQHLELARNLAIRFNNKFVNVYPEGVFKVPKAWNEQLEFMNLEEGVKIKSLSNPEKKMSKSDNDPKGTIYLNDSPENVVKKIMSAQTDTLASVNWDSQNQPGITNLLQLLVLFKGINKAEVLRDWQGKTSYGDLKKHVAGIVKEFLIKFQDRYIQINDTDLMDSIESGEERANEVANQTLLRVQKAVGLR